MDKRKIKSKLILLGIMYKGFAVFIVIVCVVAVFIFVGFFILVLRYAAVYVY